MELIGVIMKQWYNSKFGKIPFKEVLLVEFSFQSNSKEETSQKQYSLLLNDDIIQAHLEHETKKGIAILTLDTNPEIILKAQGIKYNILSREKISYEEVVKQNFMHTN